MPDQQQQQLLFPNDNDVICGRGTSSNHKGNALLRKLVAARKAEYNNSTRRDEKTRISNEILKEMKRTARFLFKTKKDDLWVQVDEASAREKISHALRSKPELRKPPKRSPKKQKRSNPRLETKYDALLRSQQSILSHLIQNSSSNQEKNNMSHNKQVG